MDFQRNFQHCLAKSSELQLKKSFFNTEEVEYSLEQFGVGWNRNLEAPCEIQQNFPAGFIFPPIHTHTSCEAQLTASATFHSRLWKYSKSSQINGSHSVAVEDAKSPVQEVCNTWVSTYFLPQCRLLQAPVCCAIRSSTWGTQREQINYLYKIVLLKLENYFIFLNG